MREFKVTFDTDETHEVYGKIKCRRSRILSAIDKQDMKRILKEQYPNLSSIVYSKDLSVFATIHK